MISPPRRIRHRPDAQINIVPYIDVMLVLLVIFMMTTPIIEQGVEVDLPQADAKMVDFLVPCISTTLLILRDFTRSSKLAVFLVVVWGLLRMFMF